MNIWIARSVVDQYYGLRKNNVNMPDNLAREGKDGVEWMSSQLMHVVVTAADVVAAADGVVAAGVVTAADVVAAAAVSSLLLMS